MFNNHLGNFGAINYFPNIEPGILPKDKHLAHLLRRTLLGTSFTEYCELREKPLEEIVNALLQAPFEISHPLKDYSSVHAGTSDFGVKIGETWKDDVNYDYAINQKRKKSLKKWLIGILYSQSHSLRPKMILFWHNYFPVQLQKLSVATRAYDYFFTIMNYSLENFKDLFLYQVTGFSLLEYHNKIKPASENLHKFHANIVLSNYLFGGDCTKYISRDRLKRFTRLLREWSALLDTLALSAAKRNPENAAGDLHQHSDLIYSGDLMEKLAVREFFQEINSFTARLLQHEKVAHTLAERLFKWFVHNDGDDPDNKKMIQRIAENAMSYNYDIKKLLSSILLDEQFYSTQYYNCLTKSPVEFLFGIFKETNMIDIAQPNSLHNYSLWEWIHGQAELLGQSLGDPPDEKGWPAFEIGNSIKEERLLAVNNLSGLQDSGSQTGLLMDFFSQTHFSDTKEKMFKEFLQTGFGITDGIWEAVLQKLHNKDEKVRGDASRFVEELVIHLINTPAYHYC